MHINRPRTKGRLTEQGWWLAVILALIILGALAVLFSYIACASLPVDTLVIPAEDAKVFQAVIRADLAAFIIHYKILHDAGRPPNDAEFGYWSAKWENAKAMYQQILSKIKVGSSYYDLLVDLGLKLFDLKVAQ